MLFISGVILVSVGFVLEAITPKNKKDSELPEHLKD